MKYLIILSLLISNISFGQVYTEDQMYKRTLEAAAKFYGLDVVGEEAFRRLQMELLPKEYYGYIPYIGTLYSIFIDKRITYRMEF